MDKTVTGDRLLESINVDILREIPLFGGISDDALRFLLQRAEAVSVPAGRLFFREHDRGDAMFVLTAGKVTILKQSAEQDYPLLEIEPGGCFGEMALIDFYPRSASALAKEDCTALRLSLTTLHQLYAADLKQFTLIQMNMGREVSRRLRETSEQLFQERVKHAHWQDGDTLYSA